MACACISTVRIVQRSRLRESALLLVAHTYDNQYDVPETSGPVDRVEQAYHRLNK